MVGVAQDVTEVAQHNSFVAAMARELRQLVDTANAQIFGIDVDGNVNEWNDKTAEITGFEKEEAIDIIRAQIKDGRSFCTSTDF